MNDSLDPKGKKSVFLLEESMNNEENDLWENVSGEVEVTVETAVPDHELIFDNDEVYQEELYQGLLRRLPIYQQNRSAVQRRIRADVDTWITMKQETVQEIRKGNRRDNLYQSLWKDDWQTAWLLPVVLDRKHLYYTPVEEEEYHIRENGETLEVIEELEPKGTVPANDPRGYILRDLAETFVEHDRRLQKYLQRQKTEAQYAKELVEDLVSLDRVSHVEPDAELEEPSMGNRRSTMANTWGLRYWNLSDPIWGLENFHEAITNRVDVMDEHGNFLKQMIRTKIPASDIQVVGIARLPRPKGVLYDSMCSPLTAHRDLRFLWNSLEGEIVKDEAPRDSRLRVRAHIQKIEPGTNVVITAPKHGLKNGMKIRIAGSNTIPSIDGVYEKDVQVLDDDRFTVGVSLLEDSPVGDQGILISLAAIPWVQFEWNPETKTWDWLSGPEEHKDKLPKELLDIPVLLWSGTNVSEPEAWRDYLQSAVPTPSEVLTHEEKNLNRILTIHDWSKVLGWYRLKWSDVPADQWTSWYDEWFQKTVKMNLNLRGGANNNLKTENKNTVEKAIPGFWEDAIPHYHKSAYPHEKGSTNDTPAYQWSWLLNQSDRGQWFLQTQLAKWWKEHVQPHQQDLLKQNEMEISQISSAIDECEKTLQNLLQEEELAKQKEKCEEKLPISKFVKEFESWDKARDETMHGLESYSVGSLAVVKNPLLVLRWTGNQWKPDWIQTHYEGLCNLAGNDCALEENECQPKMKVLLEETLRSLEKQLEYAQNFTKQLQEPKTPEKLEQQQTGGAGLFGKQKEDSEPVNSNPTLGVVDPRLVEIDKFRDPELQLQALQKLWNSEGIRIGCRIVSIETGMILGCEHEYELMQIQTGFYSQNVAAGIQATFLSKYSIPVEKSLVCRYCGKVLDDVEFDIREGFDKRTGQLASSRGLWESDQTKALQQLKKQTTNKPVDKSTGAVQVLPTVTPTGKQLPSCEDPEFRSGWIEHGGQAQYVPVAREICEWVHFVMDALGLESQVDEHGFWETIHDMVEWTRNLPTLEKYAQQARATLQRQGQITRQLSDDRFQSLYEKEMTFRRKRALLARLHVWITTTWPLPQVRAMGDAKSQFAGWTPTDSAVLFWAASMIEWSWDPVGNIRPGSPKYQQAIQNIVPILTKLIEEFSELPTILKRKKAWDIAQKHAQEQIPELEKEGPEAGPRGEVIPIAYLEKASMGPEDVPYEWADEWVKTDNFERMKELREEANEVNAKMKSDLLLYWLHADENVVNEQFAVNDENEDPDTDKLPADEYPWYPKDKREKLKTLESWLNLRPNPLSTSLNQAAPSKRALRVGVGKLAFDLPDPESNPEFLKRVSKEIILNGPLQGQQHDWDVRGIDLQTGLTEADILEKPPTFDEWKQYKVEQAKRTAVHTKEPIVEDYVPASSSSLEGKNQDKWTLETKHHWLSRNVEEWYETVDRTWKEFEEKMIQWRQPSDVELFRRRLIAWLGKYMMEGEFGYVYAQRFADEKQSIAAAATELKTTQGKPMVRVFKGKMQTEANPDIFPPLRSDFTQSSNFFEEDKEDTPQEKKKPAIWHASLSQDMPIQVIQQRVEELKQLIVNGFKRNQQMVIRSWSPFSLTQRYSRGTRQKKDAFIERTLDEWKWLDNYQREPMRKETVKTCRFDVSTQELNKWVSRILPQDWIKMHENKVNIQESFAKLAELDEEKISQQSWLGILMGTWVEVVTTLIDWLRQDFSMIIEDDFGMADPREANQIVAEWIESVLVAYEKELKYSHVPFDDILLQKRRLQRESTYEAGPATFGSRIARGLRDLTRQTDVEEEEEGEEELGEPTDITAEREKLQERELMIREAHPEWSDQRVSDALDEAEHDEMVDEEEGAGLFIRRGRTEEQTDLGLDYGEQGEDVDEDNYQ